MYFVQAAAEPTFFDGSFSTGFTPFPDEELIYEDQPEQPTGLVEQIGEIIGGTVNALGREVLLPALKEAVRAEEIAAIRKNRTGQAVGLFLIEYVLHRLSDN